MAFDVAWHDDNQSIIRIDIHGSVSWDQLHAAMDKVVQDVAGASHRVDIIFHGQTGLPPGNALPHFKATLARLTPYANMGLLVSVTPRQLSPLVKMMIDIMMRVYGFDMKYYGGFASGLDEAVALIMKDRAKATVTP